MPQPAKVFPLGVPLDHPLEVLGTAATAGIAGPMCQAPDWMVVDHEGKIVATSPCRRTCLVHLAPLAFPLEQMV